MTKKQEKREWVPSAAEAAEVTRRGLGLAAAVGALAVVTACDDPLVDPQDIQGLRVLGARLEADGDPERATPRPGETATVRWLVAAPGDAAGDGGISAGPRVAWTLAACAATPDASGVSRCSDSPFAEAAAAEPAAGQPALRLIVPATAREGTAGLAVVGAVCSGRLEAPVPADEADCAPADEGTRVLFGFDVSEGGRDNLNPSIGMDALALAGSPWAALPAPAGACSGTGLREVRAGAGEATLELTLGAEAAERLTPADPAGPTRETLLVSHFSTLGKLDRAFSRPRESGARLAVSVAWKPPAEASDGGDVARFYFVVRDDRGGADFAERAVCVVP